LTQCLLLVFSTQPCLKTQDTLNRPQIPAL
jgi:hypothetical protein